MSGAERKQEAMVYAALFAATLTSILLSLYFYSRYLKMRELVKEQHITVLAWESQANRLTAILHKLDPFGVNDISIND